MLSCLIGLSNSTAKEKELMKIDSDPSESKLRFQENGKTHLEVHDR